MSLRSPRVEHVSLQLWRPLVTVIIRSTPVTCLKSDVTSMYVTLEGSERSAHTRCNIQIDHG
jgi:hypothetical protein